MEGSREDNGSSHGMQEFQSYQEQLVIQREQQAQHYNNIDDNKNQDGLMFPGEATNPSILPWPHPSQFSTSCQVARQENFFSSLPPLPPPPPPPPLPPPPSSLPHLPFYGDLYARRAAALQFAYGGGNSIGPSTDTLGLAGLYVGSEALVRGAALPSSSLFGGLQAEVGRMSQQEILDAKALAASKSHSEAERRRRERINAHLAKLRSMLPSTTKTDKASLLAEVIQHVKELKRQTSEIAEESPLPSEADELTVDAVSDEDGRLVVRASLCCDDRSELLPDLIKALKALRLRALKAEITTLGGRVKNVLVVTGEDGAASEQQHSISAIQDALKAVMERAGSDEPSSSTGIKRQRTTNLSSILQHNTSI